MGYWNYRVIKETKNGESLYSIRETHYNDKDEIERYSDEPEKIIEEDLFELKWLLEQCAKALEKPIIEI